MSNTTTHTPDILTPVQLRAEVTRLRDLNAELASALSRVIPWMGRLIAEGAHLNSVAPNDAVGALDQAEAAIAAARGE